MDFDRRTVLLSSLLLTSGCAKAGGETTSGADERSAKARAALPEAPVVPVTWQSFKSAYLQPDGRIVDTGNGGVSHSEGQGYGMLFAEAAGDQEAFDSIFGWTELLLARKDVALYSWRYAPADAIPVADINNATDGDMLIAWALMRAHTRWHRPEYAARARLIRSAIGQRLIVVQAGRSLLLPALTGFVAAGRTTINPSYYIWPALDLFRKADGDAAGWGALIADGERLGREARFGPSRLPCDWVDISAAGVVAPAAGKPPRFGFDAIRVPLYQVMGGRRAMAAATSAFWLGRMDGGAPVPAWVDVVSAEEAPYPLSTGGAAVVRRLTGRLPGGPVTGASRDYYSDALAMLVRL